MAKAGSIIEVRQGSPAEQKLLRRMLHERGFKINSNHATEVSYDEEGHRYFYYPDAFWMTEEEMPAFNSEFQSRARRA